MVLEISLPGSGSERVEVITHAGRSEPVTYPESLVTAGQSFATTVLNSSIGSSAPVPDPDGLRVRPVPRGPGASLRVTEWLTKEITRRTKLKVVGNPDEADLILEATINTSRKPLPD